MNITYRERVTVRERFEKAYKNISLKSTKLFFITDLIFFDINRTFCIMDWLVNYISELI